MSYPIYNFTKKENKKFNTFLDLQRSSWVWKEFGSKASASASWTWTAVTLSPALTTEMSNLSSISLLELSEFRPTIIVFFFFFTALEDLKDNIWGGQSSDLSNHGTWCWGTSSFQNLRRTLLLVVGSGSFPVFPTYSSIDLFSWREVVDGNKYLPIFCRY